MPIQTIDTYSTAIARPTQSLENTLKEKLQISDVTPESTSDYSTTSSSASSASSLSGSSASVASAHSELEAEELDNKITISEHKRQELAGEHQPEPLLMDNPGRFVLFPIQNPEVCMFVCLFIDSLLLWFE